MIGIYAIRNKVNDAVYIGSSINIAKRRYNHNYQIKKCSHNNRYLTRAIKKYGSENFIFEIIEECEVSVLKEREQFFIDKYRAFGFGYNLLPNAYRNCGYKHTKSALIKMGMTHKGVKFTKEHKKKISDALKNYKRTQEHCNNISLSKKGKITRINYRHSQETKNKMSVARKKYYANITRTIQ